LCDIFDCQVVNFNQLSILMFGTAQQNASIHFPLPIDNQTALVLTVVVLLGYVFDCQVVNFKQLSILLCGTISSKGERSVKRSIGI
jgi:hypothetical protein